MKRIFKITEAQQRLLTEAMNDTFSYDELSSIPSFRGRYDYCVSHLGRPQGRGSSRVVFQIDDDKVLKLALNGKGIAQNGEEDRSGAGECGLSPKVYDRDVDDKWLLSEFVLPARKGDFKQCLGLTFDEFVSFLDAAFKDCTPRYVFSYNAMDKDRYEDIVCQSSEDYSPIYDWYSYVVNYEPPYGDMRVIRNYGMTMRDGEPTIVLLDSGLSDEIYNQYYRRR